MFAITTKRALIVISSGVPRALPAQPNERSLGVTKTISFVVETISFVVECKLCLYVELLEIINARCNNFPVTVLSCETGPSTRPPH